MNNRHNPLQMRSRIGEGIPIPDSLGEEATFINICIGNGSLKCHRVLIPTTPSFGDKVSTLALPLRPLYSNISLLSFLLFLRDSHFNSNANIYPYKYIHKIKLPTRDHFAE